MNLTKFYEDTQRLKPDEAEKLLSQLSNSCRVFSTVSQDDNEEQWLENRSRGIGGSDVGTICGINKYSSPRLLYFKKTGQYEDGYEDKGFSDAAKERMGWGHKLEPIVADEFQERMRKEGKNIRVVLSPATLQHNEHEWALANVDRFIIDEEGKVIGVLEVKTADARLLKDWEEGDIPMSYIYQLQWYLYITGIEYGAFAALVGGNNFQMIEVYRNDALIEETILPMADKFWNYHVKQLVPPDIVGNDADSEYLGEAYGEVDKNSEITFEDESDDELAELIFNAKIEVKELEAKIKDAQNKLKDKMKRHEIGYTSGHIIKWSPRKQQRVDTDRLKEEYPEIYEKVKKQISYRVFTVK